VALAKLVTFWLRKRTRSTAAGDPQPQPRSRRTPKGSPSAGERPVLPIPAPHWEMRDPHGLGSIPCSSWPGYLDTGVPAPRGAGKQVK